MERFMVSEDGPARHQPIFLRAARAAVATEDRALKRLRGNLHVSHPKATLFLIILHGLHAITVYFYAKAIAYPLPRGVINNTYKSLVAFWMFTTGLGFILGSVDGAFVVDALRRRHSRLQPSNDRRTRFLTVVLSASVCMVFAMIFGLTGTVAAEVAAGHSYGHACEHDWITVLLEGPDSKHRGAPYRATFSLSADKAPLFTFTAQDPDRWQFTLAGVDAASPAVLPALRNVTFDDPKLAVSGLCYGDDATTPCMTGRYDPIAYLSFDVTANGTRARSRSPYREWSLDSALSVILRRVDDAGSLSPVRILQTSTSRPGDCKQLKVCVAQPPAPTNLLGADILVAVGWLLGVQGEYAVKCTR